ncbi:hypothetical protein H9S87_18875 (plasmid) [Bacillus pumilus]|uniref:hypothetical protein n=1 Tax=Bacillus pumilus TaxID=1408 RepID=UPI0016580BF1|nr:hypothetical protein [Bacillus pumilus]QNP18239.1 hypothetical protein H9S87_18875 [Bacillus pumilus]
MKNKQYSVKIEVEVGFTSHQEAKKEGIQDILEHLRNGSIEAEVREIHHEVNTIQINEKLGDVQNRIAVLKEISIFHPDGLETELKYLVQAIQKLSEGDQQALTVIEYIRSLTYNDDLFDLSSDVLKRFE